MPYEFVPPSTPPRIVRTKIHAPGSPIFETPKTPRRHKDILATPSTTTNTKSRAISLTTPGSDENEKLKPPMGLSLLPITPEFTPKKSPRRSSRKRKINADEIFMHTDSQDKESSSAQFGLFLPAPSTIGSGRKLTTHHRSLRVPDFDFESLSKFNVEDDYEKNSFIKLKEDSIIQRCSEPETPKLSIIDDELVKHWHGKSFNNTYSSDEDDLSEFKMPITRKKLKNPFVSESSNVEVAPKNHIKSTFNPFMGESIPSKPNETLKTHIEYINKATGEKKLIKMSPRQASYKPRKLDFSKFVD